MKTLGQWFSAYGESHQNPTNKKIHWVCVPLIYWSILALLFYLNIPFAILVAIGVHLFYCILSIPLAIGMALVTAIMIGIVMIIPHVLWVALSLFILAWIGQFWGHKIEGKKPSFLTDILFLLIGPLWVMGFLYRRLGIRY